MWKVEYKAKPGRIFNFPNPDKPEVVVSLRDGDSFACKNEPKFSGPGITISSDGITRAEPKKESIEESKEKLKEEPKLEDEKIDDSKEDKELEPEEDKPEEKPAEKSKKKKKKDKGIGGKRIN
jgi:hypothetical protein